MEGRGGVAELVAAVAESLPLWPAHLKVVQVQVQVQVQVHFLLHATNHKKTSGFIFEHAIIL